MLIRFTKSSRPDLWINPDNICAVSQNDEFKDSTCSLKSNIRVVLGTPSEYPNYADDSLMNWADSLEFEFDKEKDCRSAFKMLQDCMGGSFSI